ncbi:AraC family transcriptional regulator [Vreelandella neptunia]|uniref:Helix-turn-helix domain-containing protein n=1 Tax=Vreelandella neptunia TaxID=115551 RepID=A0ABZ0YND5_9GAMM|nr:helix-turn-helix domain-containing protein [Halomonas neptunia]MDN3558676.1 helix-turn-helix domain-containing protein [Halomonas neptunia]WQH13645.1 helix-turn-helix domain-containing protein [Halomonas neptunia]
MLECMPSEHLALPQRAELQEVVLQLFTHHSITEPLLVPAVAEPLLVMVLSGSAIVEERSLDGDWEMAQVQAGDFYLTSTASPYEMRWQAREGNTFEVMHLYLAHSLVDKAYRHLLGSQATPISFLDISAGQDDLVRMLLEQMRRELVDRREPSSLFVSSLAQALAVHLVRTYRAPKITGRRNNALQAYKLRRVIDRMNQRLAEAFSLADLADAAQLSEYHFSRLFKQAMGLSPSQYFIRLRMGRARQLLLHTDRSIIDIGMEVGYSNPSHFSQVFRHKVGISPSAYRRPPEHC